MQNVLKDLDARMKAALEAMGREFATVRTGRASAGPAQNTSSDRCASAEVAAVIVRHQRPHT